MLKNLIQDTKERLSSVIIPITSRKLSWLKRKFIKTKPKERRLPIESFNCDSTKIFSFLNGWISTDGCITKKGVTIYNTSYNCLRDLQLLLSRLNIKSTISDVRHLEVEVRGVKHQRCSSLSIHGYNSVNIIYQNLKKPKRSMKKFKPVVII